MRIVGKIKKKIKKFNCKFLIRKADQFRQIENEAATKIQSWYRGLKLRIYIK